MGSGASLFANANSVTLGDKATTGGGSASKSANSRHNVEVLPQKVIPLNKMSRFLKVYRNNDTGEALVMNIRIYICIYTEYSALLFN